MDTKRVNYDEEHYETKKHTHSGRVATGYCVVLAWQKRCLIITHYNYYYVCTPPLLRFFVVIVFLFLKKRVRTWIIKNIILYVFNVPFLPLRRGTCLCIFLFMFSVRKGEVLVLLLLLKYFTKRDYGLSWLLIIMIITLRGELLFLRRKIFYIFFGILWASVLCMNW